MRLDDYTLKRYKCTEKWIKNKCDGEQRKCEESVLVNDDQLSRGKINKWKGVQGNIERKTNEEKNKEKNKSLEACKKLLLLILRQLIQPASFLKYHHSVPRGFLQNAKAVILLRGC